MKKEIIIIFFLSFICFSIFTVTKMPANSIIQDEPFYYFQGIQSQTGNIQWLSHTQPPAYPLIIGFFESKGFNLLLLRLLSSLIMAINVALLYYVITKKYDSSIALLTVLIFTFTIQTFELASRLYTESFFLLFAILSFVFFEKLEKAKNKKIGIFFGFMIAFSIWTRLTGLFLIPLYLVQTIQKKEWKQLKWYIIPILSIILLLLAGTGNFIAEKITIQPIYPDLYEAPATYGLFFILLGMMAFYHPVKKWFNVKKVTLFYLLGLIIFSPIIFYRYLFAILPLVSLLIGGLILETSNKWLKKIVIILLVFHFIFSVNNIIHYQWLEKQNHYVINATNENCQELQLLYNSCTQSNQSTPIFDQESNTTCHYRGTINLKDSTQTIRLNYVDDFANIQVDSNVKEKITDAFNQKVIKTQLEPGIHTIDLNVTNVTNIGGIGQILFCR